jgi:hypothetical protein
MRLLEEGPNCQDGVSHTCYLGTPCSSATEGTYRGQRGLRQKTRLRRDRMKLRPAAALLEQKPLLLLLL